MTGQNGLQKQYISDHVSGRHNNFDFLRFIAAVMVIYSHSFAIATGKFTGEPLFEFSSSQFHCGNLAVVIFFIISGFLVTASFDRTKNAARFFYNRALRILPGLIFVVLLTAFMVGPFVSDLSLHNYFNNSGTYSYLLTLTLRGHASHDFLPGVFSHNALPGSINGSLWTLYWEALCYILVGFLGIVGLLKRRVALSIFILSMIARPIVALINPGTSMLTGTSMTLLQVFLGGMLCYLYRDKIRLDGRMAVVAFILLLICLHFGFGKQALPFLGTYVVLFLAFWNRLKLSNFAKYGDLSYGLYIYAFPVQQTVTQCFGGKMSQMLNFIITLPIVICCAYISWHVVEKRFLRLKKLGLSRKVT